MISLVISFVVFFWSTSYLIEKVAWRGLDEVTMQTVLEQLEDKLGGLPKQNKGELQRLLEELTQNNKGMVIEILAQDESWYMTTEEQAAITKTSDLLLKLSQHGRYQQQQWTVAQMMHLKEGEKVMGIVIVPKAYYRLLSWNINGEAGSEVIRSIVLIGWLITLIVSTLLAILFSRNMIKRFQRLYYAMSQFSLGNTKLNVKEDKKDEIGELAHHFNKMVDKITLQVTQQQEEEKRRKELVSNISHDLRTPLSSIVGYTESLRDEVYDSKEEEKKYLDIVYKKALYMEQLLAKLLDFSRLENNRLVLSKTKVDIGELIRELLIEYLPSLTEKDIDLIADLPEVKIELIVDEAQLSRVIRNLVDNAIQYGSGGKVIKVTLSQQEKSVQISVSDRGQGIPKEELPYVFDRFYRGDKGRNTKSRGMGLGLAIVKEIVTKHGGKVEAISEVGIGTTMKVTLFEV